MLSCKHENYLWEVYKDADGKWRWRRTAPNGQIVRTAYQGYASKRDCMENARRNGCQCM